jgi:phosphoribosylaminoimidazolecarboxamide formyltransferase/IMP cyclohydrolase
MLRSSAKNFRSVTVITDPSDYRIVLNEMRDNGGATTLKTRFRPAEKVFLLTHQYEGAITKFLAGVEL